MSGLQEVLYSFMLAASVPTSASTEAAPKQNIVMGIDDFCPYTYLEPEKPGFLVEAIDVILSRSRQTTLGYLRAMRPWISSILQPSKATVIRPS